MPEETVTFTFAQIAEALVRYKGIHEGLWGIRVEFGLGAGNLGPTPDNVTPTAIVPVVNVGLSKFDKPSNLTVDAAQVNPPVALPTAAARTRRRPKKTA